jgi:hypothetical protein
MRSLCDFRKSWANAAVPPTWTLAMPTGGAMARIRSTTAVPVGVAGEAGLIASSRTVSPRR